MRITLNPKKDMKNVTHVVIGEIKPRPCHEHLVDVKSASKLFGKFAQNRRGRHCDHVRPYDIQSLLRILCAQSASHGKQSLARVWKLNCRRTKQSLTRETEKGLT